MYVYIFTHIYIYTYIYRYICKIAIPSRLWKGLGACLAIRAT